MFKYKVTIKEILEKEVVLHFEDELNEESLLVELNRIKSCYKEEKIILDADDFLEVSITIDTIA